ncbi:MAG: chemotaxis response regulator protein-glutamate methylesterase [Spirochaetales bacterium]|nr:chemotaxis response regulator protein-glutamate methylesterase [Spirochaetales bacterium]
MRNLITRIVEGTPGLVVADRAMNGVFALNKIPKCDPDVIVLDIEMPEMNGIEFLKERKRLGIEIPVVILSSLARKGAQITMDALALGAADFLTKPSGSVSADLHTVAQELSRLLLVYGTQYRKARGKRAASYRFDLPEKAFAFPELRGTKDRLPERKVNERPVPLREGGPVDLVAIGISTGGPNALREVLAAIDPALAAPIVVVQHMPPGFTEEFARSLDRICPLDVKEAADRDLLRPGRVLIAPGDKHILVERKALAAVARLSDEPTVNGHRPSADVLFASAAKEYQNRALGVIMTGMGRDGARELASMYREGAWTLGQDEETSVVYGMPKVAFELGGVREQVALKEMAGRISAIVAESRSAGT